MKKRFWISWYQKTEDYRPLVYPPQKGIIGWWCSGTRLSDGSSTLVALVEVENEDNIPELLKPHWKDEERSDFRFVEEVDMDWKPNNRFPLSDWMKERI